MMPCRETQRRRRLRGLRLAGSSVMRVISGGEKSRMGAPQVPAPRLT